MAFIPTSVKHLHMTICTFSGYYTDELEALKVPPLPPPPLSATATTIATDWNDSNPTWACPVAL